MVYCGKPSRGCQNCKTRRIKCDEVRPSCTQCRKSSRVCPGYPDEFDLIFRNETAAVKRRAQRAFSNASSKTSPKSAKKPSVSPSEVPLVWDTSPVDVSPQSERLEWLDESTVSTSRHTPPRSGSTILDFEWENEPLPARAISPQYYESPNSHSALTPVHDYPVTTKDSIAGSLRSLDSAGSRMNYAVAFFFRHLVQMPRSKDSLRGYIEVLGPMYTNARSTSILHQATHALALASLSNGQKSPLLRVEARRLYGKALRDVGDAIKDPVMARSNEVLMSILLFSLYEAITSSDDSRTVWTRHINGAVTLVKLRGEGIKKDPTSLHLFRAVRASMLTASIQQGKTIEAFPSANGWRCDEDMEVNAANRLTLICINLPNIKYYAQDLLSQDKTPSTIAKMMELIRTAKDIDSELEHWALTLGEVWEPRVQLVTTEVPENLKTAQYWKGPVHIYEDLSIANVWNDYRVSRIFCQAVILGCVAALPLHARTHQVERISAQAVGITQQMVDDFCSTVPYLLGIGREFEAKKVGRLDQAAMKATGAYFAVWPLFVTKKIPTIPDSQKTWLLHRLYHIGKTFGLSEDQVVNLAQRHVLTSGPQFSYEGTKQQQQDFQPQCPGGDFLFEQTESGSGFVEVVGGGTLVEC